MVANIVRLASSFPSALHNSIRTIEPVGGATARNRLPSAVYVAQVAWSTPGASGAVRPVARSTVTLAWNVGNGLPISLPLGITCAVARLASADRLVIQDQPT